ncbi:hypothetical protein ACMHYQ_23895 [Ectopseudomonas guguanensis]|uniref:hypothetical protein n=1 Tax=Ectopseudomonas guguanensis TaxID=1198456 RepID=UPI00285B8E3B|nr:hypothetical protein [Pseudomonas guguanensis]MDR8016377.1 hypothetical protein [Pseudomonas guguanensis]
MKPLYITVEDHAVPQLITSALEAYEIGRTSPRKKEDKLETFGLLWGYMTPERGNRPPRIIVTTATVETSALVTKGSANPDLGSLRMKMEFVTRYWPHLEVVGTFHSHPYDSLSEAREYKGWQASSPDTVGPNQGDTVFWPRLHEELFLNNPYLGHLIISVTALQKTGWALPKAIEGDSGFELSLGKRKIWITSYASEAVEYEDGPGAQMMDALPVLDIPSMTHRAIEGNFVQASD